MPTVGPVTLGQDLFWRLLSGQQVLPIQRGCDLYTRNFLDYWNLRAVDALETGRNAFTTGQYRLGQPAVVHQRSICGQGAGQPESLVRAVRGPCRIRRQHAGRGHPAVPTVPALLPQQTDGHLPDADVADAVQAAVQFPSGSTTRFAYDTDTGTYGMLHNDGSPQLDANTGIQAAFDNLLVLYSASTPRDDGRTLDYDLTMGGGLWLNGGHLWHITWTQGTGSTFAFYDADAARCAS